MKKKIAYVIGGIISILVITNPSISDFKAYLGAPSTPNRDANYFIFSHYKLRKTQGGYYLGILGNFYFIPPKPFTLQDSVKFKMGIYDPTVYLDTLLLDTDSLT